MAFRTTRKRLRYHRTVCSRECENRTISCIDCGRFSHIDCVGFCESVLDVRDIEYVCRECVYSDEGQYNWIVADII